MQPLVCYRTNTQHVYGPSLQNFQGLTNGVEARPFQIPSLIWCPSDYHASPIVFAVPVGMTPAKQSVEDAFPAQTIHRLHQCMMHRNNRRNPRVLVPSLYTV